MYLRPRFRGNFDIVRLGIDSLLLKSEHLSVKLEGKDVIDFLNIVIPKLDGRHTFEEIRESLSNYKETDITNCFQLLIEHNLLEEGTFDHVFGQRQRPRMRFLSDMGIDIKSAEKKISEVTVTIFGLGGHGAYLIPALANEGFGVIKCVDTTLVSQEDLYISPIFKTDDIDKTRESALIDRIKNDFPRTKFEQSNLEILSEDDVYHLTNNSHILVSCVDKGFSTINYWLNKAALRRGLPLSLV